MISGSSMEVMKDEWLDRDTEVQISRLKRIDWDFFNYKSRDPGYILHWYPARIIGAIPSTLIGLLSKDDDVVLDPFCGTGTNLVEAARAGRPSLGYDISHIAVLISEIRLQILRAPKSLLSIDNPVDKFLFEPLFSKDKPQPNEVREKIDKAMSYGDYLDRWFSLDQLSETAFLFLLCERCNDTIQRKFFSVVLSHCLRQVVGYANMGWSHLSDNVFPKKISRFSVAESFKSKLEKIRLEIQAYEKLKTTPMTVETHVFNEDSCRLIEETARGTVDIVITSPPYPGTCDYALTQRLSLPWFSIDPDSELSIEIGSRHYRHRGDFLETYKRKIGQCFMGVARRLKKYGKLAVVFPRFNDERDRVIDQLISVIEERGFKQFYTGIRNIHRTKRGLHWNIGTAVQQQIIAVFLKIE